MNLSGINLNFLLGHAPFGEIIFVLACISPGKAITKFEVSYSDSFEHVFYHIPKMLCHLTKAKPLLVKIFYNYIKVCQELTVRQM